jgi:hypothetical protein
MRWLFFLFIDLTVTLVQLAFVFGSIWLYGWNGWNGWLGSSWPCFSVYHQNAKARTGHDAKGE